MRLFSLKTTRSDLLKILFLVHIRFEFLIDLLCCIDGLLIKTDELIDSGTVKLFKTSKHSFIV